MIKYHLPRDREKDQICSECGAIMTIKNWNKPCPRVWKKK